MHDSCLFPFRLKLGPLGPDVHAEAFRKSCCTKTADLKAFLFLCMFGSPISFREPAIPISLMFYDVFHPISLGFFHGPCMAMLFIMLLFPSQVASLRNPLAPFLGTSWPFSW